MSKHPIQPLEIDDSGHWRFKQNAIVRYLLDEGPFDMNRLADLPFSREDREQFAQLIGYSLTGFGELWYVSDKTYERASAAVVEVSLTLKGNGKQMSCDPPYDPPDFDYEEPQIEAPIIPPTNMRLTIEVGLTEYSPNGLLELIARALLKDIGGRDRWAALLNKKLQALADEQARELIQKEVNEVWAGSSEIDFRAIVQIATREYMTEKVDNSGDRYTGYNKDTKQTRLAWLVANLTKKAMDAAFKEAETEWRERTKDAIRETLAETLAVRLAKALPSPPELR